MSGRKKDVVRVNPRGMVGGRARLEATLAEMLDGLCGGVVRLVELGDGGAARWSVGVVDGVVKFLVTAEPSGGGGAVPAVRVLVREDGRVVATLGAMVAMLWHPVEHIDGEYLDGDYLGGEYLSAPHAVDGMHVASDLASLTCAFAMAVEAASAAVPWSTFLDVARLLGEMASGEAVVDARGGETSDMVYGLVRERDPGDDVRMEVLKPRAPRQDPADLSKAELLERLELVSSRNRRRTADLGAVEAVLRDMAKCLEVELPDVADPGVRTVDVAQKILGAVSGRLSCVARVRNLLRERDDHRSAAQTLRVVREALGGEA